MYAGELVHTYLYDMGGEVRLADLARKLASADEGERIEPGKSAPRYVELVRPLHLRYQDRSIATDRGELPVRIEAHIYGIGAVGVELRIPFEVPTLDALNDLTHAKPAADSSWERVARGVADAILRSAAEMLVETYVAEVEPENYLVIVITRTPVAARDLLEKHGRTLAGLVSGERRPERLSDEEVEDNLRTWFRYYDDDLVVVDWERALVIEPSGRYEDVLTVVETANLELLELRAYDRYLDAVLEEAYDDLTRFYGRGGLFRSARGVQEELSNARIDLVRVTDAINNIGKIFGDYYLAKLHLGLAERFHLKEWETIVREKMATLNELYTLASHEVEHRRGVVLEGMIVLLFVVDLVLIYLVSGK